MFWVLVELPDDVADAALEVVEGLVVLDDHRLVSLDRILDRLPLGHHEPVDPRGHRLREHVDHALSFLPRERHRGDY